MSPDFLFRQISFVKIGSILKASANVWAEPNKNNIFSGSYF